MGGADPVGPDRAGRLSGTQEERRVVRARRLGTATLACPLCDAPVLPAGIVAPTDSLGCPFCGHTGAVRDFLSLAAPPRPARVELRVVQRAPASAIRD
jgi:hypothetical protein